MTNLLAHQLDTPTISFKSALITQIPLNFQTLLLLYFPQLPHKNTHLVGSNRITQNFHDDEMGRMEVEWQVGS